MKTSMPKPSVGLGVHCWAYSESQLRAYGQAEYNRAIEDAAETVMEFDACNPGYMAAAIRALKETP